MKVQTNLEVVLEDLKFLIRKHANDIYEANKTFLPEMLPEDYTQEMNLELCRVYKQLALEQREISHLLPICIKILSIERLHYLSQRPYISNRRRDAFSVREESGFPEEFENIVENGLLGYSTSDESPEKTIDDSIYETRITLEVTKYEKRYPGITRFFKESLRPSESILSKYDSYINSLREDNRILRNVGNTTIPPTVLLELLGESRNRLYSFRRIISFALKDIGIKENMITPLWKPAQLCFEERIYASR